MFNRFITALSKAKILVPTLLVLFLALGFLIGREMKQADSTTSENDVEASSIISPEIIFPIDPPLKSKTTTKRKKNNYK